MTGDCYQLNPLRRGGTAQDERTLRALLPSSIQLDERRVEDLIAFAHDYAGLLAYYGPDNQASGDWRPLLSSDPATLFARISRTNYRLLAETWDKFLDILERDLAADSYKPVFDIVFSVFLEIDELNAPSVFGTPFRGDLEKEIRGRLADDLEALIGYYNGGVSEGLIDPSVSTDTTNEAYAFANAEVVLDRGFSGLWGLTTPIAPDSSIYDVAGNPEDRIDYSLSFVKAVFRRAYEAYVRLIIAAEGHLRRSLTEDAGHKPQNALLLAFFTLFGHAQEDLNGFTERHLRFYFRDVLRLREKPARPDTVHVLVDLARHVDRHLIEAGTELKAGKDALGRPLVYVVDDDMVANRASIASVRRVHVDPALGVLDAPVANSGDGVGGELDEDNPRWRAFGSSEDLHALRRSRIGFAVASPTLRLGEGKRVVTLTIELKPDSVDRVLTRRTLASAFEVTLSGEEEWIAATTSIDLLGGVAGPLVVKVVLPRGEPPVVDYDPEVLEGGYDTAYPVMQVHLREDAPDGAYASLRVAEVQRVGVHVDVDGVESLVLHGDHGPLDPAQPFQPFGPRPRIGSTFRVGSWEAMSKALDDLDVTFTWAGLQGDIGSHYNYETESGNVRSYVGASTNQFKAKVRVQNGPNLLGAMSLFDSASGEMRTFDLASGAPTTAAPDLEPFDAYRVGATRGFVEFELSAPPQAFGHAEYPRVFTRQVAALAGNGGSATLPAEPYTPTLQRIMLGYRASSTVEFVDGEADRLFRIHPFGHERVSGARARHLLPPFDHRKGPSRVPFSSALYVGVADARPREVVSVLFQVAGGTEDASIDPPGIVWSYLSREGWILLDEDLVGEGTGGLLESGVVRIQVPHDAVEDATLLPGGMRWLRLSIADRGAALPLLVGVEAQAVRATFDDRGNDPTRLASPLAPGSIAGLVKSDSAVKKVRQPYPSVGGRMEEEPGPFYTRISERLRHKQRAVTIWDYERLVLEAFPDIYKVRCLNHTDDHTERKPGAVRIVVIPDMRTSSFGEKFQPTVSNDLRTEIAGFLRRINCTFVDLKVENPMYEKVRARFNVAFREGLDEIYHKDRLKVDIDRFLAPWGFGRLGSISFGGSLHQSTVLHFVENLPYVDYVTDFRLEKIGGVGGPSSVVEASTSRSILTTAQDHHIDTDTCLGA